MVPVKIGVSLFRELMAIFEKGIKISQIIRFVLSIICIVGALFFINQTFSWMDKSVLKHHDFLRGFIVIVFSWISLGLIMSVSVIPILYLIKALLIQLIESPKSIVSGISSITSQFSKGSLIKKSKAHLVLGRDMESKAIMDFSQEERNMHCHVLGSTGSGKTESVILPMIEHDISHGKGVLFIDGKGDLENFIKILGMADVQERLKDVLFFSLSHTDLSHTYNPFLHGNPTEIKDKIISSFIWTEEFYKKSSESVLLTILRAAKNAQETVSFKKLYAWLSEVKELTALKTRCSDNEVKNDLNLLISDYVQTRKSIQGLIADIGLIAKSEFKQSLESTNPDIDLNKAYRENQIVYIQLNTQGYEETARRLGRIILQDLKTVSNDIQSYRLKSERYFFPVYIDEFASFASESFIELLNKARGAGLAITMAHQSLGDLLKHGEFFQIQIMENTNIKVIMRQDHADSSEALARAIGTETSKSETYQIEDHILWGKTKTGLGSVREVQEFLIHPDKIKRLQRGEAIILVKQPFKTGIIKAHQFNNELYKNRGESIFKSMKCNMVKPSLPRQTLGIDPLEEFRNVIPKLGFSKH